MHVYYIACAALPAAFDDSRTADIINALLGDIPTRFPSIHDIRAYVNAPLATRLPSLSLCDNSSIDSSVTYASSTKSLVNHITSIVDSQCIRFYDTTSQDKSHHAIDTLVRDTFMLFNSFCRRVSSLGVVRNATDDISSHPLKRPDFCFTIKSLPILRAEEGDAMDDEKQKLVHKLVWNKSMMLKLPYVFAYAYANSCMQFFFLNKR